MLNPFATPASATLRDACGPTEYRARPGSHLFHLPGLRRWLRRELDSFAPDIVHVMLLQATVLAPRLPHTPPTRWIITHAYGEGVYARRRPRLSALLDRWGRPRYDGVVGMSNAVRRFVVDEYGMPPDSVSR